MSVRPDFSTEALNGRWKEMLDAFFASDRGRLLLQRVEERASVANVYPPTPFRALEITPFEQVRVVVLGQDPYHTPGKAAGLSFSVPEDEELPPSLKNIFKELEREFGVLRTNGLLVDWAEQGVLLLNTILTVEEGKPLSHKKLGWELLTDEMIRALSIERTGLVFMLWGRPAQEKAELIDDEKHVVLVASHPSPLSVTRGPEPFAGCGHFRRANEVLAEPIDWVGVEQKASCGVVQPTLFGDS